MLIKFKLSSLHAQVYEDTILFINDHYYSRNLKRELPIAKEET